MTGLNCDNTPIREVHVYLDQNTSNHSMERSKPLKADPEKTKKWIQDSRKPLPQGDKPLKRTEMSKKPTRKKVDYEKELDELTPALTQAVEGDV